MHSSRMITLGLLGPLSCDVLGSPVVTTAPKQRQVLALLALNLGRVVSVPTLVEELWGDAPPRSYATTLQTYILQVRNAIAATPTAVPGARQALCARHAGYLLDESMCETDVAVFESHVRAGRQAAERYDHRRVADEFGKALSLWRGAALVDVRVGPVLEIDVASLEEARLGAFERRIEADLALGRHVDVLPELVGLSARNPLNENLAALLMVALYRCGRVDRAIQTFSRLRRLLVAELGIEPGLRVQRLLAAIQSNDSALHAGSVPWLTSGLDGVAGAFKRRPHPVEPVG